MFCLVGLIYVWGLCLVIGCYISFRLLVGVYVSCYFGLVFVCLFCDLPCRCRLDGFVGCVCGFSVGVDLLLFVIVYL